MRPKQVCLLCSSEEKIIIRTCKCICIYIETSIYYMNHTALYSSWNLLWALYVYLMCVLGRVSFRGHGHIIDKMHR